MLLYGIVWVSFIFSYLTEVRRTHVIGNDSPVARPAGATGGSTAGTRSRQMEH